MSGPTPSPEERRAIRQRASQAAIKFDRAWHGGKAPRIEDYLAEAPTPERADWLEHLLAVEFSIRDQAGERYELADYLRRFPDDVELVASAFGNRSMAPAPGPKAGPTRSGTPEPVAAKAPDPPPLAPPEPPRVPEPPRKEESRELLLGILALQNGFIDHRAFIKAVRTWSRDRSRRLGAILIEADALTPRRLALLEDLVEQHRELHGEDINTSLSIVDVNGSLTQSVRDALGPDDRTITIGPQSPSPEPEADTDDGERTGPHPSDSAEADDWAYWTRHERYGTRTYHDGGNLGRVFKARDGELRRDVAFKEMRADLTRHALSRSQFLLEGLVTGGLEHPGIVPVYGLGLKDDSAPFYVMKFVRGPSLMEKLRQLHGFTKESADESAPTLPQLLRHFISACQAVAYAHSRGILHRDLKPEHVMLGAYGETMVVDWGLAATFQRGPQLSGQAEDAISLPRDIASHLSGTFGRVGTLHYMSPEQAQARNDLLDQRSDIYSLGATLYCLLTGQTPQKGHDFSTAMDRILSGEFPRPRSIKPWIPPALEAICLKSMAHRPDDRYPTATALARDLERYLDDEPVQAYPDTLPMRATRWLRKHRTFTAGGATLLCSSTLFLGGLLYQTEKANTQIRREQTYTLAARDQAEKYLQTSLSVIESVVNRISNTELPKLPGTEKLRQEIISSTTSLVKQLLDQDTPDIRILQYAARAYRDMGNLRRLLGDPDAQKDYEESLKLYDRIEQRQSSLENRRLAIETLTDFAELHRMRGRHDLAGPMYEQALADVEDLLSRSPDHFNFQYSLARVCYNYAAHLLAMGRYEEAYRHSDRSYRLLARLVELPFAQPMDRLTYLIMRNIHGKALRENGRPAEAAAAFQDVVARADLMTERGEYATNAGFFRVNARYEAGRIDEANPASDAKAIPLLTGAIEDLERMAAQSAEIPHYWERCANARTARALRLARRGQLDAACEDLRAALAKTEAGLTAASDDYSAIRSLKGAVLVQFADVLAKRGTAEDQKLADRHMSEANLILRPILEKNPLDPIALRATGELNRLRRQRFGPPQGR